MGKVVALRQPGATGRRPEISARPWSDLALAPTWYRYALADVSEPDLHEALDIWFALAGPHGRFRLGLDGDEQSLRLCPPLMSGASTLVQVDRDLPQTEWRFGHWGPGFRNEHDMHYLCGKVGHLPVPQIIDGITASLRECLDHLGPAVYRMAGLGPRGAVVYDVLRLPVVDRRGRIARFLTKSVSYVSPAGTFDTA